MQGFGFTAHGRTAFGATGGYPCTVEKLSDFNRGDLAVRFALGAPARAVATGLRKEKLDHVKWYALPDGAGSILVAVYAPPSDFFARAGIHTILTTATRALKDAGVQPSENCPLCGLAACDGYACLEGEWRPVHLACLKTRLELPDEDHTPPRKTSGHVLTGIAGALVGALFGALPIWALALSRDTLYWALYAFIPILSGLAYRTARGKASTNVAGIAVLCPSLLAALVLEQVYFQLWLSHQQQANIPFSVSVPYYIATHSFASSVREMLFCLLALVVGYLATMAMLRRYSQGGINPGRVVRGTKFIRSTAMPIRPLPMPGQPDELDDAADHSTPAQGGDKNEQ